MAVKPEIDDMPDTQRVEIFELQFGRLTRRSDMIVEATPVVDGFRVGMSYPPHRRNTGREGEFPSAPFRSGCLQDTKLLKRGHAIDPEHDQESDWNCGSWPLGTSEEELFAMSGCTAP